MHNHGKESARQPGHVTRRMQLDGAIDEDVGQISSLWSHHKMSNKWIICTLFASLLLSCAQVTDDYTVIGRSLFKKETNLQLFVGLKVTLSTGETGVIEGGFGQSGKFKIRVQGKDLVKQLPWCFLLHITVSPPSSVLTSGANSLSFLEFLGLTGQFSGCGKSGRPDIPSHIPRIPLGIARVPGEAWSVFILPSVAQNPRLHTRREEKTKISRKRASPTSFLLPYSCIIKSLTYTVTHIFRQEHNMRHSGV